MRVNVNLNIVPFATAHIKTMGREEVDEKIERPPFYYGELETTNVMVVEYNFGSDRYNTPKTTAGI